MILNLLLELRDSLSRVGSDLKQKVIESVKSTWRTINDFALAHRTSQTMAAPENISEKEEEGTQSDAVKDFDDSICKGLTVLYMFILMSSKYSFISSL